MSKRVTAPLVIAKREDGSDVYVYGGGFLPDGLADGEEKRLAEFLEDDSADGDAEKGWADLKVGELKAEIEKRNESREDDAKLSTDGNKADLVAALEADDEAQAK